MLIFVFSLCSLEKALMLGKIEGKRRRGRRMRWLDGISDSMDVKFEQTLGDGEVQGSLACYSPWGCKELDTTERLNNTTVFVRQNTELKIGKAALLFLMPPSPLTIQRESDL